MSPCDDSFGFCINIEVGYLQIFPSDVSFGFLSVQGAYILASKLSSSTRLSHFASYFTSEDGGQRWLNNCDVHSGYFSHALWPFTAEHKMKALTVELSPLSNDV